jgi:hypothetical protein
VYHNRSGYANNRWALGVGEARVDVCASNSTVALCGIVLPDVLLVSVQGHRKIGTRVSFAVRESASLSVALQVSSQFEPSSSRRIVVAKSVIPLSHLG